jgi:hypothetical protein
MTHEGILRYLARLALTEPVELFRALGPEPRYLDAAFMREAGDRLEAAARRLEAGEIDLAAFDLAVRDVVREVKLSEGTVEAIRRGATEPQTVTVPVLARARPVPTVSAAEIRAALQCGRQACSCHRPRALLHCPSHDDRTPSLRLTERGQRVLFHCFAGCPQEAVMAALSARGLWGKRV